MAVVAGDVFQTQVIGEAFGQVVRHVRTWFVDSVTGVIPDASGFQVDFLNDTKIAAAHDIITPYLNCLSNGYQSLYYQCQKTDPSRYYRSQVAMPTATMGARGVCNTANLQGALNVNGVFGSRRYRASYKLGPIATLDTVSGLLVAGLTTAMDTYAQTFLLPLSIASGAGSAIMFPAIYHAGTRVPFVAGTADQIVAYTVRNQVRVKGTRTVGRGE